MGRALVKILAFALLATFTLAYLGCSDFFSDDWEESEGHYIESENDSLKGMVKIHAKGTRTYLGIDGEMAKTNERPMMTVDFTYDFSIGRTEVTCSEYNSLTKHPLKCENSQYPMTNVTFFDAVLIANSRSKKEKFDTVYTYDKATFNVAGHCTNLENYAFHPEVNGFRLPTEAEWVLVANQGWSTKKAWNSTNSGHVLHEVCSLPVNGVAVCDMAGNAMEWVNDWLGIFQDTVLTNFAGAPDGGGIGERVVKGGYYGTSPDAMTTYSRGDVYMVSSATKAEYVGFRLAFGAIENPSWMDRSGAAKTSFTTLLAKSADIRSRTGTYKTKLVFRNDVTGNLAYVDYVSASPTVTEISDTLDSYHPDISPDGRHVAFCTGLEGIEGKSSVYVRDINSKGTNLVKLDVKSAAIPRWRVLENGDTVIVYVTDAGNNSEESSFKKQSTWQVSFMGGKFGTPEKLFDGAYHGGVSADNRLAVTGARLLRAKIAGSKETLMESGRDTVWYDGEQACNASLSKDGRKQTLFLDFGGKTGQKFDGSQYDVHERLLIADSSGKLIKSIAAPSGFAFDHSEWATKGIVATLTNIDGAHKKIVYIDPESEDILELANGDELWHPAMWSKNISESEIDVLLDLDSAGIYYTQNGEDYMFVLREKMEDFWHQKDSVNVVAMGSSRTMYGIYYKEMPDWNVLNMAYPGADMYDARYLFLNYFLEHAPNIEFLVLELAPDMFFRTSAEHWIPTYMANVGFQYDAHHGFWRDGVPEGFIEAVEDSPTYANRDALPYDEDFMFPSKSWGPAELAVDSVYSIQMDSIVEISFKAYSEIVNAANDAGIKVVALIYPRHPGYKKTGSFGAYGPMRSVAKKIIDRVTTKLDVILMDENKWGDHDYTDEMAYDYDHLSVLGARQLSHRVDSLLKTLE